MVNKAKAVSHASCCDGAKVDEVSQEGTALQCTAVRSVDVLIVGGGLIGAALLLALEGSGHNTLLIETQPFKTDASSHFDARSIALSPASVRIFKALSVWNDLQQYATPIEKIHVSEQARFGSSRLLDTMEALGHVVELQHLQHALHQRLDEKNIVAPAQLIGLDKASGVATVQFSQGIQKIKARLIVAADGADSSVRQFCGFSASIKEYQQQAIVANIGLARPHQYGAYERFTSSGPMALLPLTAQRMALVWALPTKIASEVVALSDEAFLQRLQKTFGYRLGRFLKTGERSCFPLRQVTMKDPIAWPVVFIGNAAHTLHPIAGQGFNLGLRDVAMLAQCILQRGLNANMLHYYQQQRSSDQQIITHLTDGLIKLFSSELPGMALLRNMGLLAFDNMPLLKKILMRYARGLGGVIPDLVCEIPLSSSFPLEPLNE